MKKLVAGLVLFLTCEAALASQPSPEHVKRARSLEKQLSLKHLSNIAEQAKALAQTSQGRDFDASEHYNDIRLRFDQMRKHSAQYGETWGILEVASYNTALQLTESIDFGSLSEKNIGDLIIIWELRLIEKRSFEYSTLGKRPGLKDKNNIEARLKMAVDIKRAEDNVLACARLSKAKIDALFEFSNSEIDLLEGLRRYKNVLTSLEPMNNSAYCCYLRAEIEWTIGAYFQDKNNYPSAKKWLKKSLCHYQQASTAMEENQFEDAGDLYPLDFAQEIARCMEQTRQQLDSLK